MTIYINGNSKDVCTIYCIKLLSKYLKKCFGQNLVVSPNSSHGFHLVYQKDDTNHENIYRAITKNDGFVLQEENGDTFFLAKTPRGLVNATISYLEDVLGCRFFTYDDEYCPSLKTLPLVQKKVYNPALSMRTYIVGGTYDDKQTKGYYSPKLDELIKTHTVDVFTKVDDAHGGAVPFYARNTSHNFHFYCDYEKYGKTHPEFFKAISVNGVGMYTIDITNGLKDDGSIDESKDVSVVKIVIEEMKKDIIANPNAEYFSLTQEDGTDYFDDDHNRSLERVYKRSGMLIRFCNAVIRTIHSWAKEQFGRDIKLMTFAYDYAKDAPVKKVNGCLVPIDDTVVCDDNLVIQLALAQNGYYSYFDPNQEESVLSAMKEWKVVGKHFWFWGYDSDFSNYFSYFDSYNVIKENVKGLIDYGFDYVCFCASYDSLDNWQCNLNGYLYHRLLWNLSLDQEELKNEYLNHHYGPAAACVNQVMNLFHNNYKKLIGEGHDIYFGSWGSGSYPQNNPKEIILESINAIEQGEKAILDSEYSRKEKKSFLTHLSAVKATPLNLLYLNYYSYYPNGDETKRNVILKAFVKAAKDGNLQVARERMDLNQYVKFIQSSEYDIRPLWINHRVCIPRINKEGEPIYS